MLSSHHSAGKYIQKLFLFSKLSAGYYATTMAGTSEKLRVVILNTNLYLSKNDVTSGDDPAGQFEFLRAELSQAQQNNQDASD